MKSSDTTRATTVFAETLEGFWRQEISGLIAWPDSHSPDGILFDVPRTRREFGALTLFGEAFLVPTGRYPLEVELELFEETLPTSMRLRVGDERVPWRLMASNERDDESWGCGPRLVIAWPLQVNTPTTRDHHVGSITRQLIAGQRPSEIVRERQRAHLSNEAILALFKSALGIPFHHFEETMRSVLEPTVFEAVDFDMAVWSLLRVSENIS